MEVLAVLTIAMWVFFYTLIKIITGKRASVKIRLESLSKQDDSGEAEEDAEKNFGERVILPLTEGLYSAVSGLSHGSMRTKIEARLRLVGKTGPRAVEQWLSLRILPGFLLPVALGAAMFRLGMDVQKSVMTAGAMIVIFQMGMNFYVIRKIRLRKEAIEKQLPDVLDIITVSVEAGLSFDGAVERVVQKSDNQLTRELATTLKEMRMGKLRKLALRGLADRCDVPDLTIWVGAMIQADELGVGIGNVLRVQSAQIREKRRFRAREKSMKAPIKILFPLVMFIFPSIFIILLGPAVIHLMSTFGN